MTSIKSWPCCSAGFRPGQAPLWVKIRSYRIATFTAGSTSISGHPLTRRNTVSHGTGLPEPPLWVLPAHPPDVGGSAPILVLWCAPHKKIGAYVSFHQLRTSQGRLPLNFGALMAAAGIDNRPKRDGHHIAGAGKSLRWHHPKRPRLGCKRRLPCSSTALSCWPAPRSSRSALPRQALRLLRPNPAPRSVPSASAKNARSGPPYTRRCRRRSPPQARAQQARAQQQAQQAAAARAQQQAAAAPLTKPNAASSPANCGLKKEYVNNAVKFTDTCTGEWAKGDGSM